VLSGKFSRHCTRYGENLASESARNRRSARRRDRDCLPLQGLYPRMSVTGAHRQGCGGFLCAMAPLNGEGTGRIRAAQSWCRGRKEASTNIHAGLMLGVKTTEAKVPRGREHWRTRQVPFLEYNRRSTGLSESVCRPVHHGRSA
jgi:hypothetical protein